MRNGGGLEVVAPTGNLVLGIDPEQKYGNAEVQLYPGDTLVLYTDGVTEAENVQEEEYGEPRLDELLPGMASDGSREIVDGIVASVRDYAGEAEQSDDITCVVSRFLARQNP